MFIIFTRWTAVSTFVIPTGIEGKNRILSSYQTSDSNWFFLLSASAGCLCRIQYID